MLFLFCASRTPICYAQNTVLNNFTKYPLTNGKKCAYNLTKKHSKLKTFGQSIRKGVTQSYRACKMAASYRIRRSGSFYAVKGVYRPFDVCWCCFCVPPKCSWAAFFIVAAVLSFRTTEYSFWQSTRKGVTQSYRACKMAASYRAGVPDFCRPIQEFSFLNVFSRFLCVLSKMSLDSTFFVLEASVLQTAIWILLGAVLGAGCGCGALFWAYRMLRTRKREERLSPTAQRILIIAAGICGGGIGFCAGHWLPLLFLLAVFTVGMAVAVSDWLCSIIPNPTVLTVLGLKIFVLAAALLHLPGTPSFDLLSALGGMAFCFLVFSAPGLMGKRVGAGDIKLAAAMGFLLGFGDSLLAIFFMGLLMLGYCVFQRKLPLLAFLKTNIPMGPFIAAGMMIACVIPYLSL